MRITLLVASTVVAVLSPALAHAFCGFYVASAEREPVNNATIVVLLREGTTTTLSMQNDYQGAAEDFALVVPVPVVLRREQVKTLPEDVFDRVEAMAAPRLVEYWEQNPCPEPEPDLEGTLRGGGGGAGSGYGRGAGGGGGAVRVEARFAVGEYDIVVLSAGDSSALDRWLRRNGYRIPEGAGEALRPYVEAGMKFFVAKVDVDRVTFEDGRAVLSPLRVQYESAELSLPVRLGLLSSSGTQDLVVHVLAKGKRFEMANYPNVFIPTNLDVDDAVRERFGELYAALFDRTIERNPGAVVTEYAWAAGTCDPCPGPVLTDEDLVTLGAVQAPFDVPRAGFARAIVRLGTLTVGGFDGEVARRVVQQHVNELLFCYEQELAQRPGFEGRVVLELTVSADGRVSGSNVTATTLESARVEECAARTGRRWTFPVPEGGSATMTVPIVFQLERQPAPFGPSIVGEYVLTRLHYRYGRDGLDEDLVFREAPPVVGGRENRTEDGRLEEGARRADFNNFQARYAIRHAWEGEIACENPVRGEWGGPPPGVTSAETRAATGIGTVARGALDLRALLAEDVAELGLTGITAERAPSAAGAATPPPSPSPGSTARQGCGCSTSSERSVPVWAALWIAVAAGRWLRRRPRAAHGPTQVGSVAA